MIFGFQKSDNINLSSGLDSGFPSLQLGNSGAVSRKGLGSTREVGNGLTPPLLGLNVHFSGRFLNDTTQPHVPVIEEVI